MNAGGIKRRPEVEMLLVARDARADAMKKVLDWLTVEGKVERTGQKATRQAHSQTWDYAQFSAL